MLTWRPTYGASNVACLLKTRRAFGPVRKAFKTRSPRPTCRTRIASMYSLAGEPHHPHAGLSKCFFSVREKALKPKKLIILDGSAHAQFLFQTGSRRTGHARDFAISFGAVKPSGIPVLAPVPFEAAFQYHARAASANVEANSQVDTECRLHLPIAPGEELVHLRLSARADVNALDLSIVFERRRKGLALPAK